MYIHVDKDSRNIGVGLKTDQSMLWKVGTGSPVKFEPKERHALFSRFSRIKTFQWEDQDYWT